MEFLLLQRSELSTGSSGFKQTQCIDFKTGQGMLQQAQRWIRGHAYRLIHQRFGIHRPKPQCQVHCFAQNRHDHGKQTDLFPKKKNKASTSTTAVPPRFGSSAGWWSYGCISCAWNEIGLVHHVILRQEWSTICILTNNQIIRNNSYHVDFQDDAPCKTVCS